MLVRDRKARSYVFLVIVNKFLDTLSDGKYRYMPVILGNLLAQSSLLVTGVITARMLGPKGKGDFALITLVPVTLVQIVDLGVAKAVVYYAANKHQNTGWIIKSLMKWVPFQIVLVEGIYAGVALRWLMSKTGVEYVAILLFPMVVIPFYILRNYGSALLLGLKTYVLYSIVFASFPFLYVSWVLLIYFRDAFSLSALVSVWAVAHMLAGILTVLIVFHSASGITKHGHDNLGVPALLVFGVKGFLGNFNAIESYRIDQIIISFFLTPLQLGYYSVAITFINMSKFINTTIGSLAQPEVASQSNKYQAWKSAGRFVIVSVVTTLVAMSVLFVSAPLMVKLLFGNKYLPATPVVKLMLIYAVFVGVKRVVSDALTGLGYPEIGSVSEVIALVTLIIASYFLVPSLSLTGMALSMILSSITPLLYQVYKARILQG